MSAYASPAWCKLGRYDAKVGYRDLKQCFVRNIEIKHDAVFSIADKDLKDCK